MDPIQQMEDQEKTSLCGGAQTPEEASETTCFRFSHTTAFRLLAAVIASTLHRCNTTFVNPHSRSTQLCASQRSEAVAWLKPIRCDC
jgi:hypothetical protein